MTLDTAVDVGVTVDFATGDGTALDRSDYDGTSGMLSFAGNVGEEQTITVDVFGDETVELDETFLVDLANIDPNPAYEDVRNFFPTGHKPVSMVIGVSALAIPELKIEINVRAIVDN